VEVVYVREPVISPVNPALHAGIDIGLTTLAAIAQTKRDLRRVFSTVARSSHSIGSTTSAARSSGASWEKRTPVDVWSG
jgi:hypothetical protein